MPFDGCRVAQGHELVDKFIMEKLDLGMMDGEKVLDPTLEKAFEFHFGSDLGCCPSFFSCNLNKSEIAPSPSAGDDITKICSQNLCHHFMSSSLYSHQLLSTSISAPQIYSGTRTENPLGV